MSGVRVGSRVHFTDRRGVQQEGRVYEVRCSGRVMVDVPCEPYERNVGQWVTAPVMKAFTTKAYVVEASAFKVVR